MVLFAPIAPEFQVNFSDINVFSFSNPDVGVASNGSFVVVWEEPFADNLGDIDIKFAIFDSDGNFITEGDVANTDFSETQPRIGVVDDGRFVVTYVSDDDIYAQRFSANGNLLGSEILVSDFEIDKIQSAPDIDIDAEGNFAIVWTHLFDSEDADIRGRFYNSDGNPLTNDLAFADSLSYEYQPAIAILSLNDNNSTAGIVSYTTDEEGTDDIFFQTFDNQGNLIDLPSNAISSILSDSNQQRSSIAIGSQGNFAISFSDEFEIGDNDVYFRRFSADGIPLDETEIIVDKALGNQDYSQIALGNDGTIVVTYEDEGDNQVKYRQFNSEGDAITDSEEYSTGFNVELNPAISIGANNNMVIVADNDETRAYDPFARVYQPQLNTPLNRFQNKDIPGTYLFATEGESASIRQDFPNFVEEGQAFSVSTTPGDGLIQFNRFQNKDIPGTYLFATEGESASIRQDFPNFDEEGIAFYAYEGDAQIAADFYRFQNSDRPGTYLFVNEIERQSVLNDFPNFVEEGIAFEAGF